MARKRTACSDAERLKKKRESEKRRYERLKQDPDGRNRLRQKERDQYLRKKARKIVKPIEEMTEREKREKRRIWKKHSRSYRNRKKEADQYVAMNTPPLSEDEDRGVPRSSRTIQGQRRAAKNRKARSRETRRKNELIRSLQRRVEKYKKKYQRSRNKNKRKQNENDVLTPATRVQEMLSHDRKKVDVVKRLLFAEAIDDQLKDNYGRLKSTKEKQIFKRVLSGKIVRKYRMQTNLKKIFKGGSSSELGNGRTLLNYSRRKVHLAQTNRRKNSIWKFLESDINSRMCPGKKDYCSKNKVIKQKRYLSDTMKNLHKKFLLMHPDITISYDFFVKNKPFWIVPRNVTNRDTCACTKCSNIALIVASLFRLGVFGTGNVTEIMMHYCCKEKTKECLLRECKKCRGQTASYNNYDPLLKSYYFKWINKKETYFDKKSQKEKEVKKIIKEKIQGTAGEIIQEFENTIINHLQHKGRVLHQFLHIKQLKQDLKENEIILHMDFSENYSLKYAEETQSFHFGGSRQQISLHTVVVYSKHSDKIKPESFCTLSTSILHNVPSIWAHLHPILNYIDEKYGADTLHFISDSPSTQYRNKTMFYFLAKKVSELYPKLKAFTWNYQEAGHGKGAPDGIGGVTKRTADRLVAQGNDIASFDSLLQGLKANVPGVTFFTVTGEDIETMIRKIDPSGIVPFRGTMNTHQVASGFSLTTLHFHKLSISVEEKSSSNSSEQYFLGTLSYQSNDEPDSDDSDSDMIDLNRFNASRKCRYEDVYNSDHGEAGTSRVAPENNLLRTPENIVTGKYMLVELATKKRSFRYAAVTQSDLTEDHEVKVVFLRVCEFEGRQAFRLDEKDVSFIEYDQVRALLLCPRICVSKNKSFYMFEEEIDVFEQG